MNIPNSLYRRRRFPPEVIAHAVFVYQRVALSMRDIELSVDAMCNAKSKLELRGAYEAADVVTQSGRFVGVKLAQGAAAPRSSSTACRVHFGDGAMVELSVELSEIASLFRSVVSST